MSAKLSIKNNLTIVFNIIAIVLIVCLFFKAIIDLDGHYDTWFYHVPFAARIWGIIPKEMHWFHEKLEERLVGFPVVIPFLQGFLWKITNRIQATNLVDFFSFILYIYFLKSYFKISLSLSAIALLAIPLVQIHVTSAYVDLPGAVCFSILILMTYWLYLEPAQEADKPHNFIVIILAAAAAANIKLQLVPLVLFVLFFVVIRIIWMRYKQPQLATEKTSFQWLLKFIPTVFLASLLIFATPIKNTVFYGNPFYPIKMEIAGKVLNHKVGFYQYAANSVKDVPQPQRWLHSILEINAPKWSIDQWSPNPNKSRLGGYFGVYVIFNLILLTILAWRYRSRETTGAIATVLIMSGVTAFAPQSHELRYYLYWMMTLVALNLFLVTHLEKLPQTSKLINSRNLALICLIFLAIVITKTNFRYIKPSFYSLQQHIKTFVSPDILSQIKPGETVCLVNKSKQYRKAYLYSAYFHPYLDYSYSIKSVMNEPSECGEITKVINIY